METPYSTQDAISDLHAEYERAAKQLIRDEAMKHVKYKEGDIVKSGEHWIGCIDRVIISIDLPRRTYEIQYDCNRLRKSDLKPYKSGEGFYPYQHVVTLVKSA